MFHTEEQKKLTESHSMQGKGYQEIKELFLKNKNKKMIVESKNETFFSRVKKMEIEEVHSRFVVIKTKLNRRTSEHQEEFKTCINFGALIEGDDKVIFID